MAWAPNLSMERYGRLMRSVVLGTVCAAMTAVALAGCSARGATPLPTAIASTSSSLSALPLLHNTTGLVELGWSSTSSTESGRLIVSVENEDCVDPKGVTVAETSTTVMVEAWGVKQHEPCAAGGHALRGAPPLYAPLGDRTLGHT